MEFLTEEEYAERQRKNIPATESCHYTIGNLAALDAPPGETVRFGDLQIAYDEHGRVRAAKRQFAALRAAAEADQVLDSELSGAGDEAFLSISNEDSPFGGVDGANGPNSITARSGDVVLTLRSYVQDVTQGDAAPGLTYSSVTVPGQQLADLAETAIGRLRSSWPAIAARFEVGSGDTDVAVGEGAVWVVDNEDDEAETDDPVRVAHAGLWRLDLETEKMVGSNRRDAFGDVAVGEGAVWVTDSRADAVSRIDPATGKIVATIDVRDPEHVAVGEGAVWVTNTDAGTLARLDPATDTVVATIEVGTSTLAIATGEGAVWVIAGDAGAVERLDPATNAVTATIDVPGRILDREGADLAVGEGAVWVTNYDAGTVARLDPATNAVTATIDVGTYPLAIAVGQGAVWVINYGDRTLARLDPATNAVSATYDVGPADDVAVGAGTVWVTSAGTLLRIDPATIKPAVLKVAKLVSGRA
jgi:YVTN family beta-propeller protein